MMEWRISGISTSYPVYPGDFRRSVLHFRRLGIPGVGKHAISERRFEVSQKSKLIEFIRDFRV